MIRSALFCLLLLSSVIVGAQDARRPGSNNYREAVISVTTMLPVQIYLDGRILRQDKQGAAFVNNIRPGMHSIRITQRSRKSGVSNMNYERVLYENRFMVKSNVHYDFLVNRFKRVFADEKFMDNQYYAEEGQNYEEPPMPLAMNEQQFAELESLLKKESFDESRLAVAKQAMMNNYFSVDQVKQLMLLFSFDENRLDLAKYAYPICIDRNRFYLVNDALKFSASKEDLNRFLLEYKD